jgi:serine/threonine protein kinase
MEYADGRSAGRLLQEAGALPPTVALEVVEEVARALDVVYQQPGTDGRPLRLVHRDLKPANLQISPSGAVRILDFGIASAEVPRECVADGLIGTAPYIAPERRRGIEGPEGDIWSLGVTLRTLATGQAPDANGRVPIQDLVVGTDRARPPAWAPVGPGPSPDLVEVLRIADFMTDPDPDHRPRPRRVEDLCRDLRRRLEGPSLRQWSTLHVLPTAGAEEDPLVGQILTEGRPPAPPSWTRVALAAAAVVALVAASFGVGAWFSLPTSDGPVLAGVADRAAHGVTFTSNPPGASVTIDGIPSGTTPLDAELLSGVHEVRLWASGQEIERQIRVGTTSPRRYAWDGGETWKVLY